MPDGATLGLVSSPTVCMARVVGIVSGMNSPGGSERRKWAIKPPPDGVLAAIVANRGGETFE